MTHPTIRIGIDLGGTKTELIALDAKGQGLLRDRIATPPAYDATVEAIARMVAEAEAELDATGTVGVGIPGVISPATGLVKNANSTWLIGKPLDRDLEAALSRPVRLMNDANCFALSEATDGAGAGARSVFGVILGTGVGGGLVIDGRLLPGASLIAGEWGHIPLPGASGDELPGPECYCGRRGCVETWISGPGMAADHERVTGEVRTARDLGIPGFRGPEGGPTLVRWADRAARALAVVVNIIDPDVIVLGGGLSNIVGVEEALSTRLPAHVFSDEVTVRIARHHHGDSSGVRGAAWLWD